MHTVMVMAAGFALLGLCLLVGRFSGGLANAAKIFIPLWFLGAAINMYIGVSQAGYSVADEAPVFVIVFAVPAALALFLMRRFRAS